MGKADVYKLEQKSKRPNFGATSLYLAEKQLNCNISGGYTEDYDEEKFDLERTQELHEFNQ